MMTTENTNFTIKPGQKWRTRSNHIVEILSDVKFMAPNDVVWKYWRCSDDVWRTEINGKPYTPDHSMELVAHVSDSDVKKRVTHPAADLLIAIAHGETEFETEIIDLDTDERRGYEPISLFYVLTEIAHGRQEYIRVAQTDWTKVVTGSEVMVTLSDGRQEQMRFVCYMNDTVYCTRDDMIKRLSLCVLPFKSSQVRLIK